MTYLCARLHDASYTDKPVSLMEGPPYGPWGCRWATTPSSSRAASEDPNSAQVYPVNPLPDEPSLHPLTYCVLKII